MKENRTKTKRSRKNYQCCAFTKTVNPRVIWWEVSFISLRGWGLYSYIHASQPIVCSDWSPLSYLSTSLCTLNPGGTSVTGFRSSVKRTFNKLFSETLSDRICSSNQIRGHVVSPAHVSQVWITERNEPCGCSISLIHIHSAATLCSELLAAHGRLRKHQTGSGGALCRDAYPSQTVIQHKETSKTPPDRVSQGFNRLWGYDSKHRSLSTSLWSVWMALLLDYIVSIALGCIYIIHC